MSYSHKNPIRGWVALALLVLLGAAAPDAHGEFRKFWVWDFSSEPAKMRQAKFQMVFEGERSVVFVEEGLRPAESLLSRLQETLEKRTPRGSIDPASGLVRIEERFFGGLPRFVNVDERLAVLITDLGKDSEGPVIFNPLDQASEATAGRQGYHSNERNILYVNAREKSAGMILEGLASELPLLLGFYLPSSPNRDIWFTETISQMALLLTGLVDSYQPIEQFAKDSGAHSLVSHVSTTFGSNRLFSSFLLDAMPDKRVGIAALLNAGPQGRNAVEFFFQGGVGRPVPFDLVFSNFVGYLFENESKRLPLSLRGSEMWGPNFEPYVKIESFPFQLEGQLRPYSFVLIALPDTLPPDVRISVDTVRPENAPIGSCAERGSVLWKPVSPKRIAIFSVGCEEKRKFDEIHFRLKVIDGPLQAR